MTGINAMPDVRPAAVAGMFYSDAPSALAAEVRAHLAGARSRLSPVGAAPKALIAPHAGYAFSGPIAAAAYARLAAGRDAIRRVVLLGPTHRVPIRGLALPSARAFATCCGAIDRAAAAKSLLQVRSDAAHALGTRSKCSCLSCSGLAISASPFAVGDATPAKWPR
jgi:AmmeMemoRadiSam system protein B